MRSCLEPMKKVARMIREHLWGIVNAMVLGVTNTASESMNSKVQRIKRAACGFRNRERFRNAILLVEVAVAGAIVHAAWTDWPRGIRLQRSMDGGATWYPASAPRTVAEDTLDLPAPG
jgi:hypothetical protein